MSAIARASSDRLQNLPGFGQVKVKRIKDAFEKPFRNNATSALPLPSQQAQVLQNVPSTSELRPSLRPSATSLDDDEYLPQRERAPREASPTWDIELDLNDSPPPPSPLQPAAVAPNPTQKRRRSPSIEWDIEKDVDDVDVDSTKKRLVDEEFGAPAVLLES